MFPYSESMLIQDRISMKTKVLMLRKYNEHDYYEVLL